MFKSSLMGINEHSLQFQVWTCLRTIDKDSSWTKGLPVCNLLTKVTRECLVKFIIKLYKNLSSIYHWELCYNNINWHVLLLKYFNSIYLNTNSDYLIRNDVQLLLISTVNTFPVIYHWTYIFHNVFRMQIPVGSN